MSENKGKTKKEAKVKKRRVNRLFTRDQLFIVIVLVVIVASVVVGSIILNKKDKEIDNNIAQNQPEQNNDSNTNNSNNNSLIDMNNKENVEIKDGEKINTSSRLKEERNYEGMVIKDIKLYTRAEGMTDFNATLENTSGKDFTSRKIVIRFLNRDGSEYATLKGYIGDIKAGASAKIDASTTADVSNAYDFEILEDK